MARTGRAARPSWLDRWPGADCAQGVLSRSQYTTPVCQFTYFGDTLRRWFQDAFGKTVVVDEDLEALTHQQLLTEVKRLRAAIRVHRDSTGHDLCWHHPALWSLLPEETDLLPVVPNWPEFLRGCVRYRESLDRQLPDAPRSDREFEDVV